MEDSLPSTDHGDRGCDRCLEPPSPSAVSSCTAAGDMEMEETALASDAKPEQGPTHDNSAPTLREEGATEANATSLPEDDEDL